MAAQRIKLRRKAQKKNAGKDTTLLLVSRKAGSFITGAAFYVDGGFTGMRF